jgi:thiamine-phosphate pyrophosphorylase
MSNAADTSCRLCLVTPPDYEPAAFAGALAEGLAGGDVASLIITAPRGKPADHQRAAELLVPVAARRGVAALIHNDTRTCERTKADGVHIDGGIADLRAALGALRGRKIVGAGGVPSRDDAMAMGEAGADYLFFGRLDGDTADDIFPKALDLAAWWASVTVIPAMVMGGRTVASVATAARNGIDFVVLSSAVWGDRRGPRAAVADAVELLAMAREAA